MVAVLYHEGRFPPDALGGNRRLSLTFWPKVSDKRVYRQSVSHNGEDQP